MSELQDLYESINPIPEHISRCGNGYCQHVYMLIDPYASGYKDRFEGFKQGLQHQQSKVDELQLKLSEESRILHNVIDIEYKKRDELQKQIKEQDLRIKRLIESEENFERSCASYRALTNKALDEKEELQKRVDVLCKKWKEDLNNPYLSKDAREFFCLCVDELEQALKEESE